MNDTPADQASDTAPGNEPVLDLLPVGYAELLVRVKDDVLATRLRAMRASNRELIACTGASGR